MSHPNIQTLVENEDHNIKNSVVKFIVTSLTHMHAYTVYTIHPTNLALTQVAVIAASCCVGHIYMVGGGGGCSGMLLLHPVPTSADAGPDLCTLCPDLCTLHPDRWTLCLWCFPSFPKLVQTFHLHRWWLSPVATSARGAFSSSH